MQWKKPNAEEKSECNRTSHLQWKNAECNGKNRMQWEKPNVMERPDTMEKAEHDGKSRMQQKKKLNAMVEG